MSDPRFQPRELIVPEDRHLFGRAEQVSWIEATSDVEDTRVRAARLQHLLACSITAKLRSDDISIKRYAEMAGVSYDRMAKVFRGEAIMRLEDIADAERLLGLRWLPE